MMLSEIVSAIEEKKTIAIIGFSEIGKQLALLIKRISKNANIVFMDNDENKHEKMFEDIKIYPVNNQEQYALYVICSVKYYKELAQQLRSLDIDDTIIFYADEVMAYRIKKEEMINKKRIAKSELNFVVDLAEHCNLNCQNCDHFSPLAKPKFTDINEFESDIRRISELFGNNKKVKLTHIDLEGGEPLLNTNVHMFIKIVKKYCPDTIVKIFTNGLLLPKQSDEFWKTCKENEVELEITKYPISFNYSEMEELVKNYGVKMEYYSGGKIVKESSHKPLDLKGTSDKYESFHKCYMGNGECTMLKHGRIYPCTVVPNIPTFNDYFGQNVEVCNKDSIDIYAVESAQAIMDFLANPVPACRYCQPDKWTHGHKWATTKYKMSEWAE